MPAIAPPDMLEDFEALAEPDDKVEDGEFEDMDVLVLVPVEVDEDVGMRTRWLVRPMHNVRTILFAV
jgi:hypothetical protein